MTHGDNEGEDDAFALLWERFETCLEADDFTSAHALLEELRACVGAEQVDVDYAHARLVWSEDGPEAAVPLLSQLVEREPSYGDAHYDLGCIARELGDERTMIRHFLRVRALDARADNALGYGDQAELSHIEAVARDVVERLPALFAERLAHVPILIEPRPSRALVAEGFDPRALGLFDGPTDGITDVAAPSCIVLYAANLLAEFPEEPELSEQIEVTVLHEVGHFFNLDELQLEKLGLD